MQQIFIKQTEIAGEAADINRERRLILFFAGWGMDASVFHAMSRHGYDILLVYDYRSDCFDGAALEAYDEICVLAWSLGVWHADRFIAANRHLPFTRTIAINGTLAPIDDRYGIPPRIYDLTAKLPDESSLRKFYRRICGGQAAMEALMPELPQRDLDGLRDELINVRSRITPSTTPADTSLWDEIYLSDSDQIFPFRNMMLAWESAVSRVHVLHGAHHAIDFNAFIQSAFVDKALVGGRFASAVTSYEREAEVQRKVAGMLVESARECLPEHLSDKKILEIGSGVGVLTKLYQPMFSGSSIHLWDLAPSTVEAVNGNKVTARVCDAEIEMRRLPSDSVDILFSSSTIQWFNSPRRFIGEVVRALAPGGMAFISCYVDGTIPQLAMLGGTTTLHYPRLDDMLDDIPGATVRSFSEELAMEFRSAADALSHMRATGVNSLARNKMSISRTRRLMELLTVDDKAVLTFNTKFIIIKKNG